MIKKNSSNIYFCKLGIESYLEHDLDLALTYERDRNLLFLIEEYLLYFMRNEGIFI